MKRSNFIKKAITASLALPVLASSCAKEESSPDNSSTFQPDKKYRWKMITTWPPKFPVLGEAAELFAAWIKEMSGGRMEIKVYGGGELVPAMACFDSVMTGAAELASGAAYYWAGKTAAAQLFTSVPFGLNAQQMNAWLFNGGGMELWEELYAPFNLVPMPAGNTGVQMGGWFNKEINSLEDLKGLKMRMPGLGAKVLEKAGATAVLTAGGEIYTNLERGVIDATEWLGPYHDYTLGLHRIAKYYYYPGWHEPGSQLEFIFNKVKLEKLPADLQAILRGAAFRANNWVLGEFEAKNNEYLNKIKKESDVEVRPFPKDVLQALHSYSEEVVREMVEGDELSERIYTSWKKFKDNAAAWSELTEMAFYNTLQG